MKQYPAYKDSGIEWIGEIPEHWGIKPFKHVGEIVLGKMLTNDDKGNYYQKPYLRAQNISWEKINADDIKEMWFSQHELNQYRVKENDLLISEGGEVGRTAIWRNEIGECYIQNSVHKITISHDDDPLYYMFHSLIYGKTGYYDSIVNRVSIAHLTREKLKEIRFLSPPQTEKKSISRYLTRKTTQIDSLIEKKQKMIELLKEERIAIINLAVTKGLNPDVKMKDSGIEWLGDIPERWKVPKLYYLTTTIGDGLHGTPEYVEESEYAFINGNNLSDGAIRINQSTRCVSYEDYNKYKIDLNDSTILMSINGTIGNLAFYRGESLVLGKSAAYINCDKSLTRTFLFYFLQSSVVNDFVKLEVTGTTIFNLSLESIRNLIVALPPLDEQRKIVEYLEKNIAVIKGLIEKEEKLILFLQEYRTSLISEAVTGKIDVRDEVTV